MKVPWRHRFPALAALALGLAVAVAVALVVAPVVRADGDPASDVLLGQNFFLPYNGISTKVGNELISVTSVAARAGFPLRIALIGSKNDLGAVPQEFGHPSKYAIFLSYEIGTAVSGNVLVVMPNGFGYAVNGHPLSTASLAPIKIAPGDNGLGFAAVVAAERLAAAAGHPLGTTAADQSVTVGATASEITRAYDILLVLFACTALALAAAAVIRRRRRLVA